MTRRFAIFASVAVIAFLSVLAYLVMSRSPAPCGGTQVAGGDIGGSFALLNSDGETVTDKDVIDRPTLVYFGYTFCPDVCPLDMGRNAEAVELLKESGHDVKQVFITLDPARDTPEVVGEFAGYFSDHAVGLSGSEEQIDRAVKAYKAYYKRHNGEGSDPGYYLVDHSTFTYLMHPEKGFLTFYRREDTAEYIAQNAACFLND